jgi:hypothetical protein
MKNSSNSIRSQARFFIPALLATLFFSSSAFALNCQKISDDNERAILKKMYAAYLKSGTSPDAKVAKHTRLKASGTFRIEGTVRGITEFHDCWKDKNPCGKKPDYAEIPIVFYSTSKEIDRNFSKSPGSAMLECFRKQGVTLQDPPPKSFIPGF